jgi:hypothetical protein
MIGHCRRTFYNGRVHQCVHAPFSPIPYHTKRSRLYPIHRYLRTRILYLPVFRVNLMTYVRLAYPWPPLFLCCLFVFPLQKPELLSQLLRVFFLSSNRIIYDSGHTVRLAILLLTRLFQRRLGECLTLASTEGLARTHSHIQTQFHFLPQIGTISTPRVSAECLPRITYTLTA